MAELDKQSVLGKMREKAVEIVVGILLLGSWYDHKGDIRDLRTEVRSEIATLRTEMGSFRTEISDIQKKITLIDPKTGKPISISEMFALVYSGIASLETAFTRLETAFTRLEAAATQIAKSAPEVFNVLVQIRDSLKEKK